MNRKLRRTFLLSAVLALVGVLVLSSAALAQGPDGSAKTRNQQQAQVQLQVQQQAQDQLEAQQRTRTTTGEQPCCDGSQIRAGATGDNGNTYGPGDGTGPITGGQFGPGPRGKCLDLDGDGICDCRE
jgi:type II secretory pathway pseudopilin PulG